MAKATHMGTCQVCGRLQKLPGGVLSKHGYTKQWGWFNGTCWGAGHKPFEQSKDVIERAIKNSTEDREKLLTQSRQWKAGELQLEGCMAWYHIYNSASHGFRGGYEWQHVWISSERLENENWNPYLIFYMTPKDKRPERLYSSSISERPMNSILDVQRELNRQYAERCLDARAEDLRKYIEWQEGRIKGWMPGELTPIEQEGSHAQAPETRPKRQLRRRLLDR